MPPGIPFPPPCSGPHHSFPLAKLLTLSYARQLPTATIASPRKQIESGGTWLPAMHGAQTLQYGSKGPLHQARLPLWALVLPHVATGVLTG